MTRPLDAAQPAAIERQLVRERDRCLSVLGRYSQDARARLAGEASDPSRLMLFFASKEGRLLAQLGAARSRVRADPERFGRCWWCDATLSFERLDPLPQATSCLECQRLSEAA